MSLTPTKFTWVSGPGSVKVKGDWDSWKEEIELNKKEDGSFERQIPLPENKRVHFKYIVDGNWVTKESDPTVNDDGNINNTIDVGSAPKAEKLSEGVTAAAAGVGAAAAGAGAAAVAAVKGSENGQSASTTQTSTDKKAAPAQPVKEVANADIRNYLPHSLTTATHAAKPVLASTIATVTGADILRGNPEELPVSNAEAQAVQSQATKEPSSVGNAITNASKADTSNAKAGASTATAGALNSKLDAPAVAVTDAGHAANVDAARLSAGKEGGVAAGAIASAGISTTNGSASAASDKAAANAPAPASSTKADAVAAAPPSTANAPAPASSTKTDAVAAAPPSAANAPAPASSTKAAAVAAAPAAGVAAASAAPASSKASNGAAPALSPETSGVPAGAIPVSSQATNGASTANAEKTLPTAPAQAANGSTIKSGSNTTDNVPTKAPVAPTTPKKAGTVKDKKGTFRGHFKGDSETVGDTSTGSADGSRRKSSFFGKIKHALSPHSSPSK